MNFLRVCWQLLLVFVVALFLVSGLKGEAWLLEEQNEEMLVVQVFAPINEGENESMPIEGAWVNIHPIEGKGPGMSEEAQRAYHSAEKTDENGVVVFNLSRSLYYFNASIYYVYATAPNYGSSPPKRVNVTETREVSIFMGEPPKVFYILTGSNNSLFLLFLTATVATSATIVAWGLKRKHARKKQL